jgi:hypothetical protein
LTETAGKWRRLHGLSAWQWRVLLTSPFVLLLTWVRLRSVGYVKTLAAITPQTNDGQRSAQGALAQAQETAYALAVAVKYGPWKPKCLVRSMALGWFLGSKRVPFELKIGVPGEKSITGTDGTLDFSAHAWVEFEGVVLNDKPNIADEFQAFAGTRGNHYQIFDVCIESEVPLPGSRPCDDAAPAWSVSCPGEALDESHFRWFHIWKSSDGQEQMKVARENGDYLLNIFGLATFRIGLEDRRIVAYAKSDCATDTLAHLLADQVLPRALCHAGRAVIHASAIMLRDGRVMAFTGPSGRGKSTLATAFHNAGHRVLADDCLLLEQDGEAVWAVAAYPSLRLWPDTLDQLTGHAALQDARIADMAHYSSKKQLLLDDENDLAGRKVRLSALCLLNDPQDPDVEEIRLSPVAGSAAIMALVEAQFALDVRDRDVVRRDFERIGQIASVLPVCRLSFPREFSLLPKVLDCITAGIYK